MDFNFTKEEKDIKSAAGNFAQKELAEQEIETMDHLPMDSLKKMADLGFLGMMIPEEYGGVPANWVELGIVSEEMAKGSIAMAYLLMLTWSTGFLLSTHGTLEAKEKWLPDLSQGNKIGCISFTELDCGSDFSSIKTEADRDGDSYILSGEKSPVSFGSQADFAILFAKTDIKAEVNGITAFLVPLDNKNIAKLNIRNMGLLPVSPVDLKLDGVRIPEENRIGQEGQGYDVNMSLGLSSDFFRILSGLVPLGLAEAALKAAIMHAKNRMAFGRPIAQFQAISGRIAENMTLLEMGKWLCYRALWLKDQGLNATKDAAMCSWWCPKSAYQIIEDSLVIHGHVAYSDDYPFQQMLRDVIAFEMIGGTEEAMKLIIAQRVIGRNVVPDLLIGQAIC